MDYARQQRDPTRHLIGVAFVVLVHLLVIWALITGLGKQMVEGVECEGERAVTTMPAGTIGNDRPIETVNETWYSPELRIMILSKRSDPRFGESTYSVTNITRSEPYAELFLPPSDYKLIDGDSRKQITLDLEEIKEMRRKIEELEMKVKGSRRPDDQ